jgi:hypothetical protein
MAPIWARLRGILSCGKPQLDTLYWPRLNSFGKSKVIKHTPCDNPYATFNFKCLIVIEEPKKYPLIIAALSVVATRWGVRLRCLKRAVEWPAISTTVAAGCPTQLEVAFKVETEK